ncbi:MAG TPA: hypothetical protein VJA84_03430, partial [Candidatus Omnitrophota bacterium]|nr:hypothetical protein [Candidatus Omnitrophota bacterium]
MKPYGRQDILEILNKRAAGLEKGYRQNIAILGDELIGKSYLMEYWLSSYHSNYSIPVYLKEISGSFPDFADKFSGKLLFSFLKNSQYQLKEDLKQLLDKAEKHIPQTCAAIREILSQKKNKPHTVFARLLELPEILHKETSKSCIIVIDEFQDMEGLKIKDMYELWSRHIMLSKHTMYVLISSKKHIALNILSASLNLLFGNFEKLEVPAWDNHTCRGFIRERLKPFELPEQVLDFITGISGGRPFYLNVLCASFKDYLNKNPAIKPDFPSLPASCQELFVNEWGILNRRFLSLIERINREAPGALAIKLLVETAKGPTRISKLPQSSGASKKETACALTKLSALGIINKNSDIYFLQDKVFAFWLKSVYEARINGYGCESRDEVVKKSFEKELTRLFDEFREAQDRQTNERIFELFNKFSNESVEFHKKRLRLNHFKEVKMLNLNAGQPQKGIIARSANSLWIAAFKEDKVNEEDMRDFVRACKRFKYNKSQKRIFIAFDNIDDNAR